MVKYIFNIYALSAFVIFLTLAQYITVDFCTFMKFQMNKLDDGHKNMFVQRDTTEPKIQMNLLHQYYIMKV